MWGRERRAVSAKRGLDSLHYIPTRSAAPQDRSPGPLGARNAPRQILPDLRSGRVGKRKGLSRLEGVRFGYRIQLKPMYNGFVLHLFCVFSKSIQLIPPRPRSSTLLLTVSEWNARLTLATTC